MVEVPFAEVALFGEGVPIQDRQLTSGQVDQSGLAQCLKRAIGVNRGETRRIGYLFLREREIEHRPITEARGFHAEGKFAEQVCDPLPRISAADIHDPLAKHRGVQQRVQPYRLPNGRSGAH